MNKLNKKLRHFIKFSISIIFFTICSNTVLSDDILIEIQGNNFTDEIAILSLIESKPDKISEKYANYIIKTLDNSMLFENVTVKTVENKYIITIIEYPNINKIYFKNNERLKDDELLDYSNQLNLKNLNPSSINNFILEIQNLYQSFGYNNAKITYTKNIYDNSNTADIYFEIDEGKITKINKITFLGNDSIDVEELKSIIKSKTKTLINIFANNNFKQFTLENDSRIIEKYYINKGYIDNKVNYSIEYLKSNRVNINFNIDEGEIYFFEEITFLDEENIVNTDTKKEINSLINESVNKKENYSIKKINELNEEISDLIVKNGFEFFELNSLEKKQENKVSVLFKIESVKPKYTNQINIYGNSRTFDRVIRRELKLVEGDAVYKSQIDKIQKKLNSLRLFKSVEIVEKEINENLVDVEINVEETQTGTFNAGLSIGTIDGVGVVAGLSERNFYGTGRSLKALINTTDNKTQFTFETTDRIFYENNVDISYKANFKQEDFSVASSYKLDTFLTGVGLGYNINPDLRHIINLDYVIKDYKVTDTNTVASSIGNSSGESVSFVLQNKISYNTLNSLYLPKNGRFISYSNFIESPTSSSNGSLKNIITFRNFTKINKNIFSLQAKIGNILSLNDNDILTDDKFSLGGRWLRGFDTYGAGPRNSRTSYVGGNNLIVTKLDYSRELLRNSDFPIYFNLFNDYGLVWENKTKPTNNDNSLRSSVGFGIKYYSPIGPIGFTWGFPVMDEEYDIKRMFLFSVGNID